MDSKSVSAAAYRNRKEHTKRFDKCAGHHTITITLPILPHIGAPLVILASAERNLLKLNLGVLAGYTADELTTCPSDDFILRWLADTSLFFKRPSLRY